jgi:NTP pyrophosphatase (non-canonical NTP hydrolase)
MNDLEFIANQMGLEELLCTLAEECSELNHAALKMRRVMNGKNPTPVRSGEAHASLLEEIGDVRAVLAVLTMEMLNDSERRIVSDGTAAKIARWRKRLEES